MLRDIDEKIRVLKRKENVMKPNYIPRSTLLPPKQPCSHKWVHMDTKKHYDSAGYNIEYTRVDNFHCEKCCEVKSNVRKETCREEPDWY